MRRSVIRAGETGNSQVPPYQPQPGRSVQVLGKAYKKELTTDQRESVELWMRGQFPTYRELTDGYEAYLAQYARYALCPMQLKHFGGFGTCTNRIWTCPHKPTM